MEKINKQEIHILFQKLKYNDKSALEEIFRKTQKLVLNLAYSISRNKEISEEVCQNVFLKLMQMKPDKLPENSELSWLYIVTKNQTIEQLRKHNDNIDIDTLYNISETENNLEMAMDLDTYNKIIENLDETEKEIVSLKVLGDFSFREIGQILNMPMGTVQWKYYKAINSLKILISNLAMLAVIISIIIISKFPKQMESTLQETQNENMYESDISTETKNFINGEISIDKYQGTQKADSSNNINVLLIALISLVFALSIIFIIILKKYQQKHKFKSSK